MNWLSILKVVAQIAVSTGLVDKGKGWLKDKIRNSVDKAEDKAYEKLEIIKRQTDSIYEVASLNEEDDA